MRLFVHVIRLAFRCVPLLMVVAASHAADRVYQTGVARIDITPEHAVRLSGYGNRRAESDRVGQRLWAKALAIGVVPREPFVLITVDNCGVPAGLREEVLRRLQPSGVTTARFALSFSHTHSAPCLTGALVNIFGEDIPPAHQANIARYTRTLTDKLEQVALAALGDLQPARLEWGLGKARFALNRRTQGGLVDHDLPVLAVRSPEGALRALLASYASHCTTLGGDYNEAHGDWAGAAQASIEADHPGVTALIAIGCAGECIPAGARDLPESLRLAETAKHGRTVATEVGRLLAGGLRQLTGDPVAQVKPIDLPFLPLPTRAEWEAKTKQTGGAIAYHARKNLARLDRGEKLPTHVPYLVQCWSFGRDLAMVFLPGEVVGDYSLRLKQEFDADRIWVNAYTNAAPAYIPSRRVLKLGQYEAVSSLRYYDQPASFSPGIEELIVGAVHDVVPGAFLASTRTNPLPRSTTPEEAVAALQTKPNLSVHLAAAEPLVVDPVAIEFGTDGRLWVVEMRDYPQGIDGKWKPGGRIKVLEDTDGDGRYDKATVFMDEIPFPTGVMPWKKGVLVCAAPDILYGEDTDGDGRADVIRKVLTGFVTDNYQARVNSLSIGLDGWVYAANGLRGGVVHRPADPQRTIDIRGQDIRMQPDSGDFETVSGRTQYGRVRDDWGNWFGCTAGNLVLHFPIADRYARRNPYVSASAGVVQLPTGAQRTQLHPVSHPMARFNQPTHLNQVTSACGLGIYRDTVMGEEFFGDAFVCEPAHSVVTRVKLTPEGATFSGRRADDERASEFLASTSSWFTPVQSRTGPDGALWIVDMVRPVIEHPRWIPPERLTNLPVRAGDNMGRIFRVQRTDTPLRPIRNLTKLDLAALVAALDTPNGVARDLVQLELIFRAAREAVPLLDHLFRSSAIAAVRLHALAIIDNFGGTTVNRLHVALRDSHPGVRRFALSLSEPLLRVPSSLDQDLPAMAGDADLGVRTQLAFTVGEWHEVKTGARVLGELAVAAPEDTWIRAAVISSARKNSLEILTRVLAANGAGRVKAQLAADLCRTAVATEADLDAILPVVAPRGDRDVAAWHLIVLAGLQDAVDARKINLATYDTIAKPAVATALAHIRHAHETAAAVAKDISSSLAERQAAVRLLSRGFNRFEASLPVLVSFLDGTGEPSLMQSAVEMIRRNSSPMVPDVLLTNWSHFPPSLRPTVVEILASRDEWAGRFLSAIEKGAIPVAAVPAGNRQRLLKLGNDELQARAKALFASGASKSRQAVLAQYKAVATLKGDVQRGVQVFNNICSACHVFVGTTSVGPPLGTYRDKSIDDFLVAILDPNAAIEPKYTAYSVTLKDGRALAGTMSEETGAGFTLTLPGNINQKILRSEVSAVAALDTSLMPEGLENGVSLQDMADLIAYLTSNR
ncbi:MAG: dehydrogenase [Opitutus sp.]|nr:dehydrogenase [Opitutus sp.]